MKHYLFNKKDKVFIMFTSLCSESFVVLVVVQPIVF